MQNTLTPNRNSGNVNYKSVITNQWIKERKDAVNGGGSGNSNNNNYNNNQDIPTVSEDFYSRF